MTRPRFLLPGLRAILLTGTLLSLALPSSLLAWGQQGHRVTAQLAADQIPPEVASKLRAITGGLELWQLATWPDFIRSESDWDFAKPWHFTTVEDDETVAEVQARGCAAARQTPGTPCDAIDAVNFFAAVLRGEPKAAKPFEKMLAEKNVAPYRGSLEATALAFLVHFVGDLHQPLHVGRGGDLGGNKVSVNWFDEIQNLHFVWDEGLIDREDLSFSEMARGIDLAYASAEVSLGSPADWAEDSIALRQEVYDIWAKTDFDNRLPDLSYQYSHDHIGTVELQLARGGRRLAHLLTSIFAGGSKAAAD